MAKLAWLFAPVFAVLVLPSQGKSQQLEYFGKPVRGIPVSSTVKVGKLLFVSGTLRGEIDMRVERIA